MQCGLTGDKDWSKGVKAEMVAGWWLSLAVRDQHSSLPLHFLSHMAHE